MRSDLVSAVVFSGLSGFMASVAVTSGSPGDWIPAVFLGAVALLDARRVWCTVSLHESLARRL